MHVCGTTSMSIQKAGVQKYPKQMVRLLYWPNTILVFSAPITSTIDYLFNEWKYKPIAFVSYGDVSGGLRSRQMLKQLVTTVYMTPLVDQVILPFLQNL